MTAPGVALARRAYRSLKHSPVGAVLRAGPVQKVRDRMLAWPADEVAGLMSELDRLGVAAWLGGGWGVDALLGRQTRRHGDVDLFVADDGDALLRALDTLGFSVHAERFARGKLVRHAIARTPQGRVAEVVTTLDPSVLRQPGAVRTGHVDGAVIPCLSEHTQLRLHSGYAPARTDRDDVERLCATFGLELPVEYRDEHAGRACALVVPVPEADVLLRRSARRSLARRLRHPRLRPVGGGAHITLLHPFIPAGRLDEATDAALRDLFGSCQPFDFRIARAGRFPNVLYVAPAPAEPFTALTRAIHERWPEYPPYGGLHHDVTPHLTVAFGSASMGMESEVARELPIAATAHEVWLLVDDGGGWQPRSRYRLGYEQQR